MDLCYSVHFVIVLSVIPNSSPVRTNIDINGSKQLQNFSSTSSDQPNNKLPSHPSSSQKHPKTMTYPTANLSDSNNKPTGISKPQLVQSSSSTSSDQPSNTTRSRTEVPLLPSSSQDHPNTMTHPTSDPSKSNTKPRGISNIRETSFKPDLLSNKSEHRTTSPKPLVLLSIKSQELPEVNSTLSSQANETSIKNANGTVVRRQAEPKYMDILYSKAPNRFYAIQMATHAEGPTTMSTTPEIQTFANDCDIGAYYCFKTYETGVICARTLFFVYHTFPNYCMMDYVNCYYKANDFHLAYMGHCMNLTQRYGFVDFNFWDDSYLTNILVKQEDNYVPIDLY